MQASRHNKTCDDIRLMGASGPLSSIYTSFSVRARSVKGLNRGLLPSFYTIFGVGASSQGVKPPSPSTFGLFYINFSIIGARSVKGSNRLPSFYTTFGVRAVSQGVRTAVSYHFLILISL